MSSPGKTRKDSTGLEISERFRVAIRKSRRDPRILAESGRQQMLRLHVQQSPTWCRKGMGKEYDVSVPKRTAVTIAVSMGSASLRGRHNTSEEWRHARGRWLSRLACQKSTYRWNCVGGRRIVREESSTTRRRSMCLGL